MKSQYSWEGGDMAAEQNQRAEREGESNGQRSNPSLHLSTQLSGDLKKLSKSALYELVDKL